MGALAIAAKAAWAFLRGLPWQLYAAIGVVLMLLAIHHAGVVSGRHEVQAKFDAHLSADRGAEAVAKQRKALREEQDRAAFAVIGSTFEEDKTHAREKGNAVAAGVRSGALRLRPQWTCPARDLPGPAAGAQAADANAELRAASAGRIIAIGAEADAQVKGLQAALEVERAKPIAR
jgi:hypothetical protein